MTFFCFKLWGKSNTGLLAITALSYIPANSHFFKMLIEFTYSDIPCHLKVNRGKFVLINNQWKCKTAKGWGLPVVYSRKLTNTTISPELFPAITVIMARENLDCNKRKVRAHTLYMYAYLCICICKLPVCLYFGLFLSELHCILHSGWKQMHKSSCSATFLLVKLNLNGLFYFP